jgi:hypothetical protein
MNYEEQFGKELDEARIRVIDLEEALLRGRVIDAAQALVNFSYTGQKVVSVNIDIAKPVSFANVDPAVTVNLFGATPDSLAVDNSERADVPLIQSWGEGGEGPMRHYIMFLSHDGEAWPTTRGENVFDTLAEAEEQLDRLWYAYEGRGSFYLLSSTTHPDGYEA